MDDFLRDLQKQQEMIRRLTEGPLRYLRENQTAIEGARALMDAQPFNAMRETLAAIDLKTSRPEFVSAASFTKDAFSNFALRDSVLEMQRYADTHRETYEAMERAALPYKQIGEQIRAMSRYLDSSRAALADIDYGRVGELIFASESQRDLVHRLTVDLERQHANLIASLDVSEGRLASAPPVRLRVAYARLVRPQPSGPEHHPSPDASRTFRRRGGRHQGRGRRRDGGVSRTHTIVDYSRCSTAFAGMRRSEGDKVVLGSEEKPA